MLSFDGNVCSKNSVNVDDNYDNVDDDAQLFNVSDMILSVRQII